MALKHLFEHSQGLSIRQVVAQMALQNLDGEYDGYVEAVKTEFDPNVVSVTDLMGYLLKLSILIVFINKVKTSG